MKIQTAIKNAPLLDRVKIIKRKCWIDTCYVYVIENKLVDVRHPDFQAPVMKEYSPTVEDLLANDWS